ncbi:MAG: thiamine-phosphate synthase family protein [Thermoplasmatota archaeon]
MNPPFSILSDEIIPQVRKRVALDLYDNGMSQDRIAIVMGTSQAMISKYLRDNKEPAESLAAVVEDLSRELSVAALSGEDSMMLTRRFSSLLFKVMAEGRICDRHNEKFPLAGCTACFEIIDQSDRGSVLRDLATAVSYIGIRPIPDLVPAVKINIAQMMATSRINDDVASFPGRISFHDGKTNHLPPEFGSSSHLAGILLAAGRNNSDIRAVVNLKYDDRIGSVLEEIGIEVRRIKRDDKTPEDQILNMELERSSAVVDPGDFGIEPCLYIFGGSALEVVSKACGIQENLISDKMKVE